MVSSMPARITRHRRIVGRRLETVEHRWVHQEPAAGVMMAEVLSQLIAEQMAPAMQQLEQLPRLELRPQPSPPPSPLVQESRPPQPVDHAAAAIAVAETAQIVRQQVLETHVPAIATNRQVFAGFLAFLGFVLAVFKGSLAGGLFGVFWLAVLLYSRHKTRRKAELSAAEDQWTALDEIDSKMDEHLHALAAADAAKVTPTDS